MATRARSARAVRLLLDTDHSRHAAGRLRDEGYDVVAAADDALLASLDDEALPRAATIGQRVIVTENARTSIGSCATGRARASTTLV